MCVCLCVFGFFLSLLMAYQPLLFNAEAILVEK